MSRVVFKDPDGTVIRPWMVRAGMLVVETRYSVTGDVLVCVVGPVLEPRGDVFRDWEARVDDRRAAGSEHPPELGVGDADRYVVTIT